MDSTLVHQCRNDHKESRRGHIDLQKSPSSSYGLFKVRLCSVRHAVTSDTAVCLPDSHLLSCSASHQLLEECWLAGPVSVVTRGEPGERGG